MLPAPVLVAAQWNSRPGLPGLPALRSCVRIRLRVHAPNRANAFAAGCRIPRKDCRLTFKWILWCRTHVIEGTPVAGASGNQLLDVLYRLNSTAGSGCGAVERCSRAGKIKLTRHRPALQKPIDKSGVKNH